MVSWVKVFHPRLIKKQHPDTVIGTRNWRWVLLTCYSSQWLPGAAPTDQSRCLYGTEHPSRSGIARAPTSLSRPSDHKFCVMPRTVLHRTRSAYVSRHQCLGSDSRLTPSICPVLLYRIRDGQLGGTITSSALFKTLLPWNTSPNPAQYHTPRVYVDLLQCKDLLIMSRPWHNLGTVRQ